MIRLSSHTRDGDVKCKNILCWNIILKTQSVNASKCHSQWSHILPLHFSIQVIQLLWCRKIKRIREKILPSCNICEGMNNMCDLLTNQNIIDDQSFLVVEFECSMPTFFTTCFGLMALSNFTHSWALSVGTIWYSQSSGLSGLTTWLNSCNNNRKGG